MKRLLLVLAAAVISVAAFAENCFDKVLLRGETDKAQALYAPGEPMTFTLKLTGAEALPQDCFIKWDRTGDDGKREEGKAPINKPLVIKTSLAKPGFVRVHAVLVDKNGKVCQKSSGKWDGKTVFFDGGAGVDIDKLQGIPEPKDFDAFWDRQRARLAKIPLKAERIELPSKNPKIRIYAVEVACAGIRPVTGYLTVPKDVESGKKYPAHLGTHGYSYNAPHVPPSGGPSDQIFFNINAHGMKLPAFGADEGYYKALGWEIKSNGQGYAFDTEQNKDPEVAYFNGMALRVMRALAYLKSLPGWNGKDLWASGGSQGGLQTIWAAGLDPQVTKADSGITWCCDIGGTELGRNRGSWYIHWVPALAYYDPINIGKRISKNCRTTITRAGLGDYTCPPSGLAILYNNIPGPKKIWWVQGSTHGYVPPEPNQSFWREANQK